jgi:GntR family transcriptional regulator, sialic acid-inducible nan operon repressor
MPLAAVRRRKLYEEVADQLERMIHDGEYAPRDQLPSERELMREFGVGRPAIREALFHLRKMGLVEIRSGERARVTEPTPKVVIDALAGTARHMLAAAGGVENFQDARLFFEAGLARHAAKHANEDDLARFGEALDANRQSIGDLRRFQRTDVAFHYVLAVIPGNPIFTAIHDALAEWLLEQRRTTLAPGEDLKAYQAHRSIYDAVVARDPDRAEQAMLDHLQHVARRYADVVNGQG